MEPASPWSTPTQSEMGESGALQKYLSDVDKMIGLHKDFMIREIGDGQLSDEVFKVTY